MGLLQIILMTWSLLREISSIRSFDTFTCRKTKICFFSLVICVFLHAHSPSLELYKRKYPFSVFLKASVYC